MTLKTSFRKALRDSKNLCFIQKCLAFYMVNLMQKKTKHSKLLKVFKICVFFRQKIAYFYQAEFNYYYSDYKKSLDYVEYFLKFYPKHIEAKYLKAQLLFLLNKKQESWEILIECLKLTKRLKTWLLLSKIIQNKNECKQLQELYEKYKKNYSIKNQITIRNYLIITFKKNKYYFCAKKYLKENILYFNKKNSVVEKNTIIKKDAIAAIDDLRMVFDNLGVNFFLISGTFLGCIREGKFLGHDYDVDIGIWEKDYTDIVRSEILKYGVFTIYDLQWNGGLKLKHVNGIKIDIFIHYREADKIYHKGDIAKWYNTVSELKYYDFCNGKYYGFADFDTYLQENYGEWKIEKKYFDNILDTPNAVIINNELFIIHLYQLLMKKYAIKNYDRIINYLKQYGEENIN
ncbi:hypothetical protein [Campylobacter lari]|uniref:hypothetical protein n=1 Tax=Campylobacter lari TaxID=201 RepID=UPI001570DEC4|nr:hypothetical protein [Campylobacter lari]